MFWRTNKTIGPNPLAHRYVQRYEVFICQMKDTEYVSLIWREPRMVSIFHGFEPVFFTQSGHSNEGDILRVRGQQEPRRSLAETLGAQRSTHRSLYRLLQQ